jgi:hypothetical protein
MNYKWAKGKRCNYYFQKNILSNIIRLKSRLRFGNTISDKKGKVQESGWFQDILAINP